MHLTVAACVAVARAIEVGMEETGRPLLAHKDQSIGMQLEPVFDRRLQRLQRLRVMIADDRHGMVWHCSDKRVVEKGAKVKVAIGA